MSQPPPHKVVNGVVVPLTQEEIAAITTEQAAFAAEKEIADAAQAVRDQFAVAIAAGLEIVSTGTPALSATYAIDPAATANIAGIAAGVAARNRVPGGGATFEYPDATGTPRTFTGAQFLDFAVAVEDHVYALSRGETPSQPVTIP